MKPRMIVLVLGLLCLLTPPVVAEVAAPALSAVRDAMQACIAEKEIAGAVTVVASRDRIIHLDACGHANIAAGTPLAPDAIMWVASMTKPIAASAIMLLCDEGKLGIDDLVSKHLPEFNALDRPITIRNLLTHTSGLADKPAGVRASTLAELVAHYPRQPLRFEPGSKWEYCNPGINTLRRIVEIRSGQEFAAFLGERFFRPLEMSDTTFHPSPAQAPRVATSYKKNPDGSLEETGIHILLGGVRIPPPDAIPYPAGGLFSTARDLTRFYQMILSGGESGGRRYLSRESIDSMTRLQSGSLKTGFVDGMGWGLGWAVVREPKGITAGLSPGSFGHGGAFGTQAWLDPANDRLYLLMVQRSNFPNADGSGVRRAFQAAASPTSAAAGR